MKKKVLTIAGWCFVWRHAIASIVKAGSTNLHLLKSKRNV